MVRRMTNLFRSPRHWATSITLGLSAVLLALPAYAADSSGPWECSGYTGDAHTRCLQAFIDIQRDKISQLEADVRVQQRAVGQLKEQADRQNATTADLQRQMAEQSSSAATYNYISPGLLYGYPSVGFGLYLGRPWLYGSPFYGRPFGWGSRYYRPYYGRWHRH
ncbi:MAG: hypothetical protein WBB60_08315 [Nitrospira sp.]|jgi:hypothetical protein|nr:TrbC/VirB2 family protein [Nitrospira sp.]MBP6604209.1 TrbC/VirB2 family protein [Nitrospira sp.]HQY58309.1 hypothetical protein [Nitrospira sp.]HRA96929.1 hypothetical protein [Nitrospira sp.]HRC45234.1 hypothetical protein [Nitrospira sp.]